MKQEAPGRLLETRSTVPTIKRAFELADASNMSYREIAGKIGVHGVTMSHWKHGQATPSIQSVEEMLQVLGYKLEIVKL